MLKEKVAKMMKLAAAGMMLALGVAAAAPAATVQADMLQEVEPNDNPATATQLPLNEWMTGTIEKYSSEDWYEFTISTPGVTQVEIDRTLENISGCRWSIVIYDANRRSLYSEKGTRFSSYKLGLAPGKYYLRVIQYENYGPKITYQLRANFEENDSWEQERYYKDKSYENMNTIVVDKTYTGILYDLYDVDYYYLNLEGNNNISLKFASDDSVVNPGAWDIQFIEYNTKKSLGTYNLSTNETIKAGQCIGPVVIKVKDGCHAWGGNYALGEIYHLQAIVTPVVTPTVAPTQAPTPSNTNTTIVKPSATRITSIKPGKKQATIRWKKASNATGYYVYRSTKAKGGYKKIATVNGKTTYKDKKALKSKKTYYYKVISYRKNGSKVLKSRASGYKKVKVK